MTRNQDNRLEQDPQTYLPFEGYYHHILNRLSQEELKHKALLDNWNLLKAIPLLLGLKDDTHTSLMPYLKGKLLKNMREMAENQIQGNGIQGIRSTNFEWNPTAIIGSPESWANWAYNLEYPIHPYLLTHFKLVKEPRKASSYRENNYLLHKHEILGAASTLLFLLPGLPLDWLINTSIFESINKRYNQSLSKDTARTWLTDHNIILACSGAPSKEFQQQVQAILGDAEFKKIKKNKEKKSKGYS